MPIVAFGWTVAVNTPYSSIHRFVEAGIYSLGTTPVTDIPAVGTP
jgi:hypothetical protein